MSREEAISIMNVIIHMLEPQYDNDRVEEAVDMAIKALEQEPIIDKISDKINRLRKVCDGSKVYVAINDVFDIIDGYKAESEEVNG